MLARCRCSLAVLVSCVLLAHGEPPLQFLRVTPDPDVTVQAPLLFNQNQNQTMLQLAFNQPVTEGAGDFAVTCTSSRFSASVRSPHAWVGADAHTRGGATVTLLVPRVQGKCTVSVPAGAYVATATDSPSPMKEWSFTIGPVHQIRSKVPRALQHKELPELDMRSMNSTIAHLALDYENRFFASDSGVASADWLMQQYKLLAQKAGRSDLQVERFPHAWQMPSVIFRIPGRELASEIVVVGAHLDTINRQNWTENLWTGRAPGANDDGSAIAVQLEVVRLLLASDFRPQRTVEVHAYSGEEEGLYGSADVSAEYARTSRTVVSMLQLDQCGYVSDPKKPRMAVYTDNTDKSLSTFVTQLIDAYCSTPWQWSNEEHRADSDFHSWHNHGFPAAYAAEGPVDDIVFGNNKHTAHDELGNVNLTHVAEFGRLTMGFLLELATPASDIVFA